MSWICRGPERTPDLEVFTWVHPRRSSDYCLAAESLGREGPLAAWYGVADMIGRPTRAGWRGYLRTVERQLRRRLRAEHPADAEEHHAWLREALCEQNRYLYSVRSRHDTSAFGYCICVASVFGPACRVHWLGDCRAYRIRRVPRPEPRGPAFEVKALTRDHNALDRFLRERETKAVFFRNELLDLSKRLELFLGVGDDERVAEALRTQTAAAELGPEDCLLLVTDGFVMPLVRDILAVSDGIGTEDLYLEHWLARLLEREADIDRPSAAPDWSAWISGITAEVRRAANLRPEYRDDVALLGFYRPVGAR